MKNILYVIAFALVGTLSSCEKFTEIEPKGRNLLNTASDLDLLLNDPYSGFGVVRTAPLTAGIYNLNIGILKKEPIKTFNYAVVFWDESIDRAALRPSCNIYEPIYSVIGKTCNPVIARADVAKGDRLLANRYKAEAYVLRAWFHYLAVNIFAKAYNPTTAATDGGVPYVLETDVILEPAKKYTVAEVYDFILKDLDNAFKLDALLDEGTNQQRVGKSFAYAVQAKVHLSMRKFDQALVAARASLAINSQIDNHNNMLVDYPVTGVSPNPKGWARPTFSSKEDLFITPSVMYLTWYYPELLAQFDPNSVLYNYMPTQVNIPFPGDSGSSYFGMPGEKAVWALGGTSSEVSGAGLTSIDMRLTEAECLMRAENLTEAKEKLENIRKKRILTDKYTASTASSKMEVFALLKQLQRSENFNTMKDLIDLKRWNTEPEFASVLKRTILGDTYTLKPNSPLWVYPFPQNATSFNPELTQNY
ncbi:RagB/SusD family nutrient uptake outer membrane protein [Sphingobacterium tabacisoli]|uniref:RagB/SusD family nutrient uptake outer membrane protein n=1 Tax=Sphingobacterium tabacisoli TaxID=2044855 RepID=A0ABW5KYI3_9SPHI|nr:RagB/SusD family nutrient uptake outer membrane protein [Sphingobacterium tabacisoli]